MKTSTHYPSPFEKPSSGLYSWWSAHRVTLLRAAVAVMTVFAAAKLGDEFRRLLFESGKSGAIDLKIFQIIVQAWFAGRPIYQEFAGAAYPPASFVLLYPLVGWLDLTTARWFWALTTLAMLASLAILMVRESGAESRLERAFVVLLLLSMNATGVAIGNGQLILHLLPAILVSLHLFAPDSRAIVRDLLAAALFLFALVKPNVTIPFGWLALYSRRGWRPVFLIAGGYLALTVFAASFQPTSLDALLKIQLARGTSLASEAGYANVSIWLADLGLKEWGLGTSALALVGLGTWTYYYRGADRWVLIGVTALVARLWLYHRVYDDVLVILPMVALFRIARQSADLQRQVAAGVLLAVTVAVMLFPARWEFFPAPWDWIFIGGHTIVWIADLIFLLDYARRLPDDDKSRLGTSSP